MWQYLNVIHAIKVVSPHLLTRFHLPVTEKNNSSHIIYKKTWYLLKSSLAVTLFKNGQCEKVVKSKGQPRNGCGGIGWWQKVWWILCWFLVKLGWGNTNWPELLLLKFLPSTYTITAISWPPLRFHNFFHNGHFWTGPPVFYSQAVFE